MTCPICGEETLHAFRPFCSKRCADLDLSQWLSGGYALPSEDQEDLEIALEDAEKRKPTEH
ncbi:DNA gyrase inhibitor YacG [Phaeobacter sp. B1627]|uniref:DNA gyrase inhibitor YacG n=1 Tax=Phaeobacter sp. B1627 TaxID=2583809 RepID=UPI00111BC440|nr:DNA gyrase inhibitor YacG [Phaeobacter sp. B1627]TNJ43253.1 DNA gyrase inhibitor YacG [Phaeobacter sp. B1627]